MTYYVTRHQLDRYCHDAICAPATVNESDHKETEHSASRLPVSGLVPDVASPADVGT
jgi:hypothetical protein